MNNILFLDIFKKWTWTLLIAAATYQFVFWNSTENIVAIVISLIIWYMTTFKLLRLINLTYFTFSTFTIFGYCFSQFYLPIIFTSLEFKPIIFNLKYPLQLFTQSFLVTIILFVAHDIYKNMNVLNRKNSIKNYIIKIKFFVPPTTTQIWIMGFLGFFGNMVDVYSNLSGTANDSNIIVNFIKGLMPFAYAPYYLLVLKIFDDNGKGFLINKKFFISLTIYSILIFVLSILRNSRGAFMYGFSGLVFTYLLALFLGLYKMPKISFKAALIVIVSSWVLAGPLADLGVAMLINRTNRYTISPVELLTNTWNTLGDKEAINSFRTNILNADNRISEDEWTEYYLDNLFLARFCNLKINDESLEQAMKIKGVDDKMFKFSINKIYATLPQPLLDLFGISINKKEIITSSFGDMVYFLAGGNANSLGNLKTGHFIGTGIAAFGFSYLALFFLAMIPSFYMFDSLCNTTSIGIKKLSKFENPNGVTLSFCGVTFILSMFVYISQESVISFYMFLIRGFIQLVFLYYLLSIVTGYFARKVSLKTN